MTRASGVPLERTAEARYDPRHLLAAPDGTLPLDQPAVARRLATAMNVHRSGDREAAGRPVLAGELNALGLLHDVFHHLIEQYEREVRPGALRDALGAAEGARGRQPVDGVFAAFADAFPAAAPATGADRPDALEELLLTRIANENPAARPMRELFTDEPLETTDYDGAIREAETYLDALPPFGPDAQSLVAMLRAPALASPTSLAGQLRYVRDRWGPLLGSLLDRLLLGLDVIAEEERALHLRFGGGHGGFEGVVEAPSFGGLEAEPERFSWDSDWMPRLVLLAKSTYVWLDQLSRRYGREIRTLDAIPDEELDRLASWGVTGLWLIGLWQRSVASERIKRMRGNPDAVASAYSLDEYRIADDLGGEAAYENLRGRAWMRGVRLASDMVPNHMGIDSRWVIDHPDWFISLPDPPYPSYAFGGPDLSSDERVGIFLEEHYWDNSDAAVVFRREDRWTGDNRFIYHGNDGTSFPWNDTAQLDFLKPEVREQVIQTILDVARRFPVIRFDAAMVLAKKHVERLWYPEPGAGGAIPSRAEYGSMPKAEFDRRMPVEFWREVVDRVAAEVPDTLLLAEAFWLLEGYFVRTLGMHRVYNSAFMHMLRDENNAGYRRVMKDTLEFDPEILKRYVNFMNNPDEKTAVEQFGKGDKYFGVGTLLATMPGLPMLGHGQVEGFGEKYGMEFRRAFLDEQPDQWLVERHEREIFPLLHRRGMFAGAADFLLYDFATGDGGVDENVFAYSNGSGAGRSLVVYHNRFASTAGFVRDSVAYAVKEGDGSKRLVRRTLAEGLGLPEDRSFLVAFRDARTGLEYLRPVGDLRDRGLFVRLDAYQGHVFWEFREIRDTSGVWHRLAERLGGGGVVSLEDALREQELEPVFAAARAALAQGAGRAAARVFVAIVARTTVTDTALVDEVTDVATERRARIAQVGAGSAERGRERRPRDADAAPAVRGAVADPWHRAVLDTWALLEPLGRLAEGAMAGPTSRAWFDELRLAAVVAGALREHGLDEGAAWSATERVRALLALPRPSNVGGRSVAERARRLVEAWLRHPDVRPFIRVNTWEGVEWFGRDEWRELLDWALLLDLVDDADPNRAAAVVDRLLAAGETSGYRIDRLRELLGTGRPGTGDSPRAPRPMTPGAAAARRGETRRGTSNASAEPGSDRTPRRRR